MNVNLKSMMQLIKASKKRNKKLSRRLIEEWQKFIQERPKKQIKLSKILKKPKKKVKRNKIG